MDGDGDLVGGHKFPVEGGFDLHSSWKPQEVWVRGRTCTLLRTLGRLIGTSQLLLPPVCSHVYLSMAEQGKHLITM